MLVRFPIAGLILTVIVLGLVDNPTSRQGGVAPQFPRDSLHGWGWQHSAKPPRSYDYSWDLPSGFGISWDGPYDHSWGQRPSEGR